VWHGGTTVNVYTPLPEMGQWQEIDCWSMSDEKGRPVERWEIEEQMAIHESVYREEW